MSSEHKMLETALRCLEKGWFVFPLGERSKVPDGELAPNGFNSASNDPVIVRDWWMKKPKANIGIDLGRSNLTVLDFDNGAPPPELGLPNTLQVSTSRGTHVYLSGVSKQGDMSVNGVHIGEIKSTGGYVLAPFSIHPSGSAYAVSVTAPVASIPDGLIDRLRPQRTSVDASVNGPKIPRGQHDTELHRIAGYLRGVVGLEEEGIYNALVEICVNRCEGYGNDYLDMCRKHARNISLKPVNVSRELVMNQGKDSPVNVSNWRESFRSVGEMESGPIVEVIRGVLQEGTCFIGASPSDGKTLVSLSMAKAICTGEPLFGLPQFNVTEPRTVIYLIPESGDRAFRRRCEDFRMPDDKSKFMARTISMGPTFSLDDPILLQAVKETKAVVFLDTAVRFMRGSDENSAAENRMLVNDVFALLAAGAVCVILAHHATKASQNEEMTMENMLRGTSDLAAMCDQIYGIRKDRVLYARGAGPMEIEIASLKDREQIGELTTLRLAASRLAPEGSITPTISIIRETGNFRVLDERAIIQRGILHLAALVKREPLIPVKELAEQSGMSEYAVEQKLKAEGWHRVRGGKGGKSPWHQDLGEPCPFEKNVVEIKPSKKTYDLTLADVVKQLGKFLEGTSPDGEYVEETEVLQWADKQGIPETHLNKAKRRLGVVVVKEGDVKTWALPAGTPSGVVGTDAGSLVETVSATG